MPAVMDRAIESLIEKRQKMEETTPIKTSLTAVEHFAPKTDETPQFIEVEDRVFSTLRGIVEGTLAPGLLTEEERELLRLHYREGLTCDELAAHFHISRMTPFSREQSIFRKIRRAGLLDKEDVDLILEAMGKTT
jgi:DNA-directed RNA polymerase specialized sigma24 family protein